MMKWNPALPKKKPRTSASADLHIEPHFKRYGEESPHSFVQVHKLQLSRQWDDENQATCRLQASSPVAFRALYPVSFRAPIPVAFRPPPSLRRFTLPSRSLHAPSPVALSLRTRYSLALSLQSLCRFFLTDTAKYRVPRTLYPGSPTELSLRH